MNPEALSFPEILPFDSDFFGKKIGKLDFTKNRYDLKSVEAWAIENCLDCMYVLVDEQDSKAIDLIDSTSARYIDGRLTLCRKIDQFTVDEAHIRVAKHSDLSSLKAIASNCHIDSRFYADSRFDASKCSALYELWIEKSLSGMANVVFVPDDSSKAAGYITLNILGNVGNIGLLAVGEENRGRGYAKQLISQALSWCALQECKTVNVVTQYRNAVAQAVYQSMGFRTSKVERWYHWWIS
jgi:GNAT superfamily N-acetyltransferase